MSDYWGDKSAFKNSGQSDQQAHQSAMIKQQEDERRRRFEEDARKQADSFRKHTERNTYVPSAQSGGYSEVGSGSGSGCGGGGCLLVLIGAGVLLIVAMLVEDFMRS